VTARTRLSAESPSRMGRNTSKESCGSRFPSQLERQILEEAIGGAAIGRGVRRRHFRADEWVGLLVLVALVQPQGDAAMAHDLAVGPDALDAGEVISAARQSPNF
jgi:hypothetical protein